MSHDNDNEENRNNRARRERRRVDDIEGGNGGRKDSDWISPFGFDFSIQIKNLFDDLLRDFEQRMPKELIREKKMPDGSISREIGPIVYGYSFTVGRDGKPKIKQFGNLKPSQTSKYGLEISNERTPLIEMFDQGENVKIIAEVPGVDKRDIRITSTEKTVNIDVGGERPFKKSIGLSEPIVPSQSKARYNNGILEITLAKVNPRPKQDTGRTIPIE
jgi:HSP20 family protein